MGILRSLELLVLLVQAKRTNKKILYKYLSLGCPNLENRSQHHSNILPYFISRWNNFKKISSS